MLERQEAELAGGVSSDGGPMGEWGVRVGAATVTDPSLSWIKLLVSSWGSSSGVTWDQLSPLSSLLALIERLSLFTTATAAATAAGLSLSLLGGERNLSLHGNKLPTNHQPDCVSQFDPPTPSRNVDHLCQPATATPS